MTIAELVERLTPSQASDLIAIGDPANPYGGCFDALSAGDAAALKGMGLVRSYIPVGCMAPLTVLTPKGREARAVLQSLGGER